jgi:carbonic anhydrase
MHHPRSEFLTGASPLLAAAAGRKAPRPTPTIQTLEASADPRSWPEILFDLGLGDIFVCRVAGNVADTAVATTAAARVVLHRREGR